MTVSYHFLKLPKLNSSSLRSFDLASCFTKGREVIRKNLHTLSLEHLPTSAYPYISVSELSCLLYKASSSTCGLLKDSVPIIVSSVSCILGPFASMFLFLASFLHDTYSTLSYRFISLLSFLAELLKNCLYVLCSLSVLPFSVRQIPVWL